MLRQTLERNGKKNTFLCNFMVQMNHFHSFILKVMGFLLIFSCFKIESNVSVTKQWDFFFLAEATSCSSKLWREMVTFLCSFMAHMNNFHSFILKVMDFCCCCIFLF